VSPAHFAEPLVIEAEAMADLVNDGSADLDGDLVPVRQIAQIAWR
jgi:hypothetical protein